MSQLPRPGTSSTLWVVDGNHPMWDALTWADQAMGNTTTKVFSVAEMVHACVRYVIGNSRPLDSLVIFGHGTGGYQSVGAGKTVETTGSEIPFLSGDRCLGNESSGGIGREINHGVERIVVAERHHSVSRV